MVPAGVRDFWDGPVVSDNEVVILLGRFAARAGVFEIVGERVGAWQQKPAPQPPAARFPESKRQLVLVDRPGSVQADIHIGRLSATRTDPGYYPLLVGNAILGGGANSRLFNDVREKRGYAYDAHSELDRRKDTGVAAAVTQVRNEVVEPALEAVFSNLVEMGKTPVIAVELSDAKIYISGVIVMSR